MATPDERELPRRAADLDWEASSQELLARLSPEAEAIRAARPDVHPTACEILAAGWRTYRFSAGDISGWLLAGFAADRDWYAAALRDEGVAPSMLTKFYRHRGSREQEQLINIVQAFFHDQRNPAALTDLLDRWGVERADGQRVLRAG